MDPVNPYAPPGTTPPPLVSRLVADDSGLTIDYELTMDDIVGWSYTLHRTNKTTRRGMRLAWMMLGLITAMILLLAVISKPINYPLAATGVAFGLLTVGGWPFFYRWRIHRLIHRLYAEGQNYNVVGPRRLVLSPEFLTYSSPISQTVTRWIGVERIVAEPQALYIMVSAISAIPVPRRAFANDADFDRFVAAAHEFHSRAISTRAQ
jgi:YcxB-like protein